jgi:hypothetical protein
MSEFEMFLATCVVLGIIAAYSVANRWTRLRRDDLIEPSLTGNGYHYRDGGTVIPRPRPVGRSPALDAPYGRNEFGGALKPTVTLTPRMLEHVNIQRRMRGAAPLNRDGFKNAISHPWDRYDVRQPESRNDWLTYFIMYECLFSEHQSSRTAGVGGLTIDPNLPYNGGGGEFAGAGASGDWSTPSAALYTDALFERASGITPTMPDPNGGPGPNDGAAPGGTFNTQDPGPSANVTDHDVGSAGSSYSSSSDSSSSDSSSSSSSDGGSSGGGGDGS